MVFKASWALIQSRPIDPPDLLDPGRIWAQMQRVYKEGNKAFTIGKKRRFDSCEEDFSSLGSFLPGEESSNKKICPEDSLKSLKSQEPHSGSQGVPDDGEGIGTADHPAENCNGSEENLGIMTMDISKIVARFSGDRVSLDWIGCFTYAPPRREDRAEFWNDLGGPVDSDGGFKFGAFFYRKSGGRPDEDHIIKEKLDRVIVSSEWLTHFKKAGVRNLSIRHSDHSPDTRMEREFFSTPFRYLDAWSRDSSCRKVIEDSWKLGVEGFQSFILCQKLRITAKALGEWNRLVFGFCQSKIKALEKLLIEKILVERKCSRGEISCIKGLDSMCKPKTCGGLGFRRSADINFSLIAKLGWDMASNTQSLWKSVLLERYCPHSDFLSTTIPTSASLVARGIWANRDFIADNSIWAIGKNSQVNLWSGLWSSKDGVVCDSGDLNPMCKVDITVGDLMLNSGEGWDHNKLVLWLRPEAINRLEGVDFGTLLNEDILYWKILSRRIKRAYWDLNRSRFFEKDAIGSRIWKLKMHERVKLFLWKLYQNSLPFGCKFREIFGSQPGLCMLCGEVRETLCWNIRITNFSLVSGKDIVSWLIDPPFAQVMSTEEKAKFSLFGAILYFKLWRTSMPYEMIQKMVMRSYREHINIMTLDIVQEGTNRGPAAIHWGLPRPGRMKCFVDYASDNDTGAVAGVIYDWEGSVKRFGAKKVTAVSSFQGELEAIALVWNWLGLTQKWGVDFHSDNWQLVNSLSTGRSLWWNASFSFNKILRELDGFDCSVSWISRSFNDSAHTLARWGLSHNCNGALRFWR
ncbi:hypothetical protein F8388_007635 [Cannabis sativa]|uniref:RNase H type-1 domain-containing protein n=1 Tax=Cannabis sativa TaxID=3483 RepID=A0A7J6EV98_CANSA|nr:hypothetical protein F8388_007635 [Cannabis sativa]